MGNVSAKEAGKTLFKTTAIEAKTKYNLRDRD